MRTIKHLLLLILLGCQTILGQNMYKQSHDGNNENLPVREYTLTLKEEMVNKAGKGVKGMTVNGTIPGPILEFTEGEYAVIYVKNEMSVETSIHWHGILLPNFFDGVPTDATIDKLYDNLDLSRAVAVFLDNQGSGSLNAMRKGSAGIGASTNTVTITETLLKSEMVTLTGNTSTMYALTYLEIKDNSPLIYIEIFYILSF